MYVQQEQKTRIRRGTCVNMCRPVGSVLPGAAAAHCEDPGSLALAESPVQYLSHSGRTLGKTNIHQSANLII